MNDPWGDPLTGDEEKTVLRLAALTGRPAGEIVRQANVTRLAQAEFQMAVALATGVIDYLPGDGSGWGVDPAKQERQFHNYAARLFDGHADPLPRHG